MLVCMTNIQGDPGGDALISTLNGRITDLGSVVSAGHEQQRRGFDNIASKLDGFITKREYDAHKNDIQNQIDNVKEDNSELRSAMDRGFKGVRDEVVTKFDEAARAKEREVVKSRFFWGTMIGVITLANQIFFNIMGKF